jgi:hypothetical protein
MDARKWFVSTYSYVNNLLEGLFFVLLYCVVKYTYIFYSCCKESSRPEFGNSCQWYFVYVGINIALQTRRINTREGFFCNIWHHTGWKPVISYAPSSTVEAEYAITKEMKQLHWRDSYKPKLLHGLTKKQKEQILQSHIFVEQRRDGLIRAQKVIGVCRLSPYRFSATLVAPNEPFREIIFFHTKLSPGPPDPYTIGKLRLSAFCRYDSISKVY